MSTLYSQLQEKLQGHIYKGYFMASCLWHGTDIHPSLQVSEFGFKCLSCGKHGSLVSLNKFLGGRDIKVNNGKSQVLPAWKKWEQKYGDLEGIATFAHKHAELWYMEHRGIDKFYEQGFLGTIDNFLLFPVFDEHRKIVSIVLRYTGKNKNTSRYITHQTIDGKQYLYIPNRERVNNSDYVVVCYGIIDSWSFEDIGIPAVTGCVGKFSSPELLLPLNKKIYIVPDAGEENDAHRLSNSLGWKSKVLSFKYPNGLKDVDEVRMGLGKEKLLSMTMECIG
jgi:hypothetical protein